MSLHNCIAACGHRGALAAVTTALWLASLEQAHGQFVSQQVGGVSIDARGMVTNVRVDELNELK
ncbi:MAG: hypothetical protein HY288_07630, partial [Planctomycetia bacterium]|nr:hypothetical protein [Planctomycetia bacterium]